MSPRMVRPGREPSRLTQSTFLRSLVPGRNNSRHLGVVGLGLCVVALGSPGSLRLQDCWKDFPQKTCMQLRSQWCWAASLQMVCGFYDREVGQCLIVAAFYNIPACDETRRSNLPARSMESLKEFMGDNSLLSPSGLPVRFNSTFRAGPLTQQQIADEVNACRPVLAEIRRSPFSNATHLVVIVGILKNGRGGFDVIIADPYPYDRRSKLRHGLHRLGYARLRAIWSSTIYGITPV